MTDTEPECIGQGPAGFTALLPMPTFDVDPTEISAFRVDDSILFKHYFDNQEAFTGLEEYYNRDEYRFEVPGDDLNSVKQILDTHYCSLQVVEDYDPYCVVVDTDQDYSDVLRNAVLTKERSGYLILLLKDEISVEQAAEHGATRLADTHINEGI